MGHTEDVDAQLVADIVRSVGAEIYQGLEPSLSYLKTSGEADGIDRIVLSGGGAKLPGLREYLAGCYDVPSEQADPLQHLDYEPEVFGDERGFFLESWNQAAFREAGFDLAFVPDNHSRSAQGTLRGLHYQTEHTQGKLVRVTSGAVFDVAVAVHALTHKRDPRAALGWSAFCLFVPMRLWQSLGFLMLLIGIGLLAVAMALLGEVFSQSTFTLSNSLGLNSR